MSIFASATKASPPSTRNIIPVSLLLAALLTLLATLQLFHFEDFPSRLAEVGIPQSTTLLLAVFIVTGEVLALPFVLRLNLSPAFRIVSMVCGWLVGIKLLFVAILENINTPAKLDAVFGATFPLPIGTWSICAALALCVLIAWTSWGLFPLRSKN